MKKGIDELSDTTIVGKYIVSEDVILGHDVIYD